MELNRRDFLKLSGASVVGAVVLSSIPETEVMAAAREFPLADKVKETNTICCYCSVGCGAIVTTWEDKKGRHIRIEGDPDHPINQGSLCPKGMAMFQIHEIDEEINPQRLTKPLYRAPNGDAFEEKDWDWTLREIAKRVKKHRDENLITTYDDGRIVNRNERMASLGGGELDNEECYLLSKMDRALGLVYVEHCARL